MKKLNSVIGVESLPEKAGSARKLSLAEMEHELEHCTAPWMCPRECYGACLGCLAAHRGDCQ